MSEPESAPLAAPAGGVPLLTLVLLAILAAVFAAETAYRVEPTTGALHASIRTLLAFGGVDCALVVDEHQGWRLVTAPLLHADALHILFNGIALWLVGRLSERLIGVAWFAATFAASAVAGSALSIVVNPPVLLSVGASGAIVGLFVATFAVSFHFPGGEVRTRLQTRTIGTIIPALVPLLSSAHGATIDYGAHFGGAAGGLAMGFAMLALWPKARPRPRFARLAGAGAAVGALLVGAAVVPGLANYRKVSLSTELFEPWPATEAEARARAAEIVAGKPRDPRGHLVEGLVLIGSQDLAGAEAELHKALADPDMLGLLDPVFVDRLRLVLAAILLDERRPDDARAAMAPACPAEKAGGPLSASIARLKLCS